MASSKKATAAALSSTAFGGGEQPEYSSSLAWSQPASATAGYMNPANDNHQRQEDFKALDQQRIKTKRAGELLTKMSQSHTTITYGENANHDLIWRNAQRESSAYEAAQDAFLKKWPL